MSIRTNILTLLALSLACCEAEPVICTQVALEAVRVEVVGDQSMVAGVTASHGGTTRECFSDLDPREQRDAGEPVHYDCPEMGQAPARGDYTIDVHADGQRWSKTVRVNGNECHVTKLVDVTIDLASKPVGKALLALCADSTGNTSCCADVPEKGACDVETFYCYSPCQYPAEDADHGTQMVWSCKRGKWVGDKQERECEKQR